MTSFFNVSALGGNPFSTNVGQRIGKNFFFHDYHQLSLLKFKYTIRPIYSYFTYTLLICKYFNGTNLASVQQKII